MYILNKLVFIFLLGIYSVCSWSSDEKFNEDCALGNYDNVFKKLSSLNGDNNKINELINTANNDYHTPLYYAVGGINNKAWKSLDKEGNFKIVQLLALLGADPNIEHEKAYSPLHAIIMNQDEDMLDVFFRAFLLTINLNIQDKKGITPLHLALVHDKINIAEILLNFSNIDISIKNNEGRTALDEALYLSKKHFINGLNIYIKNGHGLKKKILSKFEEKDAYELKLIYEENPDNDTNKTIVNRLHRGFKDYNCKTMEAIRNALADLIKAGDDLFFLDGNLLKRHYFNYDSDQFNEKKKDYIKLLINLAIEYRNYKAFEKIYKIVTDNGNLKGNFNFFNFITLAIEKDTTPLILNKILIDYTLEIHPHQFKVWIGNCILKNNFRAFKTLLKWVKTTNIDFGNKEVANYLIQDLNPANMSFFLNTLLEVNSNSFDNYLLRKMFEIYKVYLYGDFLRSNLNSKNLKGNNLIFNNQILLDYLLLKNNITIEDYYFGEVIPNAPAYNFLELLQDSQNFNKANILLRDLFKKNPEKLNARFFKKIIYEVMKKRHPNIINFLLSSEFFKDIFANMTFGHMQFSIFHMDTFYLIDDYENYLKAFDAYDKKDGLGFNVRDFLLTFIYKANSNQKASNIDERFPEGLFSKEKSGIDEKLFTDLMLVKVKLTEEILRQIKSLDLKYALIKRQYIVFSHKNPLEEEHLRNLMLWNKKLWEDNKNYHFNEKIILARVICSQYKLRDNFAFKSLLIYFIEIFKDDFDDEKWQYLHDLAKEKNDNTIMDITYPHLEDKNLKRKGEDLEDDNNPSKKRKLNDQ